MQRLRDIIKEKNLQIANLKAAIANIFLAMEKMRFPGDPLSELEKSDGPLQTLP